MNRHDQLLGAYVPGDSPVHRLPVGVKYGIVLAGSLPALFMQNVWLALAIAVGYGVLLALARVGARAAFGMGVGLGLVIAATTGYGVLVHGWADGFALGLTILGCLWGARVLTCTTPAPELIDAIVSAARPLRWLGLSPERFGLAVALMVRTIPYLAGCFDDVRDAARARGMEGNLRARLVPVVVRAVGYAHETGDALAARGLGDDEAETSPAGASARGRLPR